MLCKIVCEASPAVRNWHLGIITAEHSLQASHHNVWRHCHHYKGEALGVHKSRALGSSSVDEAGTPMAI